MSKIHFATKRILDSVWTLAFVYTSDCTIKILSYDRDNLKGYHEEKQLPTVKIFQDDDRKVTSIELDGCERDGVYDVDNVQHVFSYTDTTSQRYNEIRDLNVYMKRKGWIDGITLLEAALSKSRSDQEYRKELTNLFYYYSTVKGREVFVCVCGDWGKLKHQNAVEAIDSAFNHLDNMTLCDEYRREFLACAD